MNTPKQNKNIKINTKFILKLDLNEIEYKYEINKTKTVIKIINKETSSILKSIKNE